MRPPDDADAGPATAATLARTITLARSLDAPRAAVWQAWTEPERLPLWWGPRGFTNEADAIELRAGGIWRFTMRGPDGVGYRNRIAFLEVDAPARLVFTTDDDGVGEFEPFRTTVTFAERGRQTLLTLQILFASAETRASMQRMGAVEGGEQTLDKLEEHVAGMRSNAIDLTLVRRFAAPRALVFTMWADAEHITRWCCPKDFTIPAGSMDFRPGGAWSSVLRAPDGKDHRLRGVYHEIVADERIVFSHAWLDEAGEPGPETMITLTFTDHEGGTKLTLHQAAFATAAARDGHAGGWGQTFDNLERHLAAIGPATDSGKAPPASAE